METIKWTWAEGTAAYRKQNKYGTLYGYNFSSRYAPSLAINVTRSSWVQCAPSTSWEKGAGEEAGIIALTIATTIRHKYIHGQT